MDLKPQNNPAWPQTQVKKEMPQAPSPWRGVEQAFGAKPDARRRWAAETLGATPPRDGPWQLGAKELARLLPPRTRKERK
jgi:hypothetical protein